MQREFRIGFPEVQTISSQLVFPLAPDSQKIMLSYNVVCEGRIPVKITSSDLAIVFVHLQAQTEGSLSACLGVRVGLELRKHCEPGLMSQLYFASLVTAEFLKRTCPEVDALLKQPGIGIWDLVSNEVTEARQVDLVEWQEGRRALAEESERKLQGALSSIRHGLINRLALLNTDLQPLRTGSFGTDDVALVLANLDRIRPLELVLEQSLEKTRGLLKDAMKIEGCAAELAELRKLEQMVCSAIKTIRISNDREALTRSAQSLAIAVVRITEVLRDLCPRAAS